MDDLQARLAKAVGERYLVERELGQGGMSHVFLAEDLKHGRKVAIKVLRPEFAQSLGTERFLREIRIAAQLSHPHILSLIDSGDADGLLYFVMFYSAGESLRERLTRERQLPIGDAIRFAQEIAEALAYAHEAGVIHRDIKPENILIEAGHAIVCDFGIARALTQAGGNELTQSGMAIGTPAYMSPEQTVGDAAVDPRTDIYSLGCVLYEMLSGDTPYMGSTPQVILARKAAEPVPSIRLVRDTVPSPIEATINRALARIPADRFSSAQQFADALSRAMATGESPKLPQRLKAAGWLTVAVLSTVAVVAVMTNTGPTVPPLRTTFRQLTAQSGVEESPSLSPNGDWVIYSGVGDGNRDIFLLSVGGRNPINLTEGFPADDIQPVFSPDGEHIAFRSSRDGGGLFVMGRTGEAARRVTHSGFNPAWSPDGTHLAYATESVGIFPLNWEGVSELWSVDLNSGQLERLSQSDAVQPSWSPHGGRIAFARRIGTPVQMNIATMPADGGEPVALTEAAATDWGPTWSPEGDFIYFSSDRGGSMNLWRVRVDEESGRALAEPEPVTTPSPFVAHPSLASQGELLAFTSVLTTQNVQRATLDLSTGTIIDSFWVTTGSRQWSSPEPSPDGEWIAFYSRDRPEGDLYVVRKDGTGLRQVTSGTVLDRMPRWSPDGVWLAYFSTRSGTLQQFNSRTSEAAVWDSAPGPQTVHDSRSTVSGVPGRPTSSTHIALGMNRPPRFWPHQIRRWVTSR